MGSITNLKHETITICSMRVVVDQLLYEVTIRQFFNESGQTLNLNSDIRSPQIFKALTPKFFFVRPKDLFSFDVVVCMCLILFTIRYGFSTQRILHSPRINTLKWAIIFCISGIGILQLSLRSFLQSPSFRCVHKLSRESWWSSY